MENKNKEETILKATEEMIRKGGYNGFSFREIAKQVGIKSSSVHYHFPTKEDLGVAVAKYYTDRFLDSLGDPENLVQKGENPIQRYVDAFRHALLVDKRMCMCGLLGAEIDGLPAAIVTETQTFFKRNIEWLEQSYEYLDSSDNKDAAEKKKSASIKAIQTLALLEGAIISSNVLGDINVFEQAIEGLIAR